MTSDRPDVRLAETQEKYGSTFIRVAPDMLMTNDAGVIRHINGVRTGYKRSSWYHSFRINPYRENMISTTNDAFHTYLKSRTNGGYSLKETPAIESSIDDTIAELKLLLRTTYLSTAGDSRPMDWANVAEYLTLDTLSKVSYGSSFGCLKANRDVHGFVESSKSGMKFMTLCAEIPVLRAILTSKFALVFFGPKSTDHRGIGPLMRSVLSSFVFNGSARIKLIWYSESCRLSQEAVSPRFGADAKDQPDMLVSFKTWTSRILQLGPPRDL